MRGVVLCVGLGIAAVLAGGGAAAATDYAADAQRTIAVSRTRVRGAHSGQDAAQPAGGGS